MANLSKIYAVVYIYGWAALQANGTYEDLPKLNVSVFERDSVLVKPYLQISTRNEKRVSIAVLAKGYSIRRNSFILY